MSMQMMWPIVVLALFCEYVDSTLGMGYGTTLTPILLLMGYEPIQIVPSVLLSEFLTGILAGVLHHEFGNVSFKPGSRPFKTVLVLALCSVVGTVAAVLVAVNIPAWLLKGYIGVLVLAMGVTILLTVNRTFAFSWKKLVGLGLLAAVNKGLSGGGYGPLVCGGQVLAGMKEKEAISITSLTEGLVCIVGVITYLTTEIGHVDWSIAPSLVLGAVISVPFAALTVKKVSLRHLRWAIGSAVTGLGLYTLINLVT
ncbi:MAG TPA: sulfite exporter TauE/SafE family protein [Chloroflexi bacterium]|nr:sulfite exporter TauE/SafE family protein [Chloroflexota bacterium]